MTTTPIFSFPDFAQVPGFKAPSLEAFSGLSSKAYEGVTKLFELNQQAATASVADLTEAAKSVMAVKSPQDLIALQTSLVQSATEKTASYGRHVYDIVNATVAEVRAAVEAQFADAQKQFVGAVEESLKNAPAGSQNAVALVKSAIAATNNAYDNVSKAAKQASEAVDANITQMTETAVKASRNAKAKSQA